MAERRMEASAPGKLVLLGEYAVLEGAPALVCAVDRRARATLEVCGGARLQIVAPTLGCSCWLRRDADGQLQPDGKTPAALGLAVRIAMAVQQHAVVPLPCGTLTLDTQAFFVGPDKMGLGSSAAVAVALARLLGATVQAPFVLQPRSMFDFVAPLHRAHQQGRGSGIDVAASCFGGFVRFEGERASAPPVDVTCDAQAIAAALEGRARTEPRAKDAGVRIHPVAPIMPKVGLQVVFSGRPASTPAFLEAFSSLKARDPQRFWAHLEELAALSQGGVELWTLGSAQGLVEIFARYHQALRALGTSMQCDIVTAAHARLADVARRHQAAYKPSGAGGGDVGVALGPAGLRALWLGWCLRRAGAKPLTLTLGAPGVRLESA